MEAGGTRVDYEAKNLFDFQLTNIAMEIHGIRQLLAFAENMIPFAPRFPINLQMIPVALRIG